MHRADSTVFRIEGQPEGNARGGRLGSGVIGSQSSLPELARRASPHAITTDVTLAQTRGGAHGGIKTLGGLLLGRGGIALAKTLEPCRTQTTPVGGAARGPSPLFNFLTSTLEIRLIHERRSHRRRRDRAKGRLRPPGARRSGPSGGNNRRSAGGRHEKLRRRCSSRTIVARAKENRRGRRPDAIRRGRASGYDRWAPICATSSSGNRRPEQMAAGSDDLG